MFVLLSKAGKKWQVLVPEFKNILTPPVPHFLLHCNSCCGTEFSKVKQQPLGPLKAPHTCLPTWQAPYSLLCPSTPHDVPWNHYWDFWLVFWCTPDTSQGEGTGILACLFSSSVSWIVVVGACGSSVTQENGQWGMPLWSLPLACPSWWVTQRDGHTANSGSPPCNTYR